MDRMWPGEFVFCPMCTEVLERVPRGGVVRQTCGACGYVHFRNPGVGAAVVVVDAEGRVLLVRRAPGATQQGRWSIPAGFVDYGEDVRAAAARELEEETGLIAEVGPAVHVASNFHDPAKLTVGIWFAGTVIGGTAEAGDDADDIGWFELDDLPPLAFETDAVLLRRMRAEG